MGRPKNSVAWPLASKDAAFQAWYKAGRPSLPAFVKAHVDPLTGKSISFATVKTWYATDKWVERANQLDLVARKKTDNDIVQQRVRMLRRQRSIGLKLQKNGMKYIEDHGFQNEFAALRGLEIGTALERNSTGSPDLFEGISTMSDQEVLEALQILASAEIADTDSQGFEDEANIIDVSPK